jgi:hypothetical protein
MGELPDTHKMIVSSWAFCLTSYNSKYMATAIDSAQTR